MPTIITFSGKAGHGKDTAVQILCDLLADCNKKGLKINYTDYLKFVASKYYNWDGNKDESGRSFLQFLGAEKVNGICPTFWVDTVIRIVEIIGHDYDFVLIGDCRFRHDIERWIDEGYDVLPFHVERVNYVNDLTDEQKNHASENSLKGYEFAACLSSCDIAGLKEELVNKVMPLCRGYFN